MTAITIFYLVAIFMLGAVMGSFLNVIAVDFMNVYMAHDLENKSELKYLWGRLRSKEFWKSLVEHRSACDSCDTTLTPKELVPIVSYLWQKGKCNSCDVSFSPQHLYIELFCGVIFTGVFLKVFSSYEVLTQGFILELIYMFIFFAFGIVLFIFDYEHQIIPNLLVYPMVALGLLVHILGFKSVPQITITESIIAAVLFAVPLFLLWAATKGRGMGMADSKLGLAIGAFLGFSLGLSAFLFSFWIGATIALVLMGYSKLKKTVDGIGMKTAVAFGPSMFLAFWFIYITNLVIIRLW